MTSASDAWAAAVEAGAEAIYHADAFPASLGRLDFRKGHPLSAMPESTRVEYVHLALAGLRAAAPMLLEAVVAELSDEGDVQIATGQRSFVVVSDIQLRMDLTAALSRLLLARGTGETGLGETEREVGG